MWLHRRCARSVGQLFDLLPNKVQQAFDVARSGLHKFFDVRALQLDAELLQHLALHSLPVDLFLLYANSWDVIVQFNQIWQEKRNQLRQHAAIREITVNVRR